MGQAMICHIMNNRHQSLGLSEANLVDYNLRGLYSPIKNHRQTGVKSCQEQITYRSHVCRMQSVESEVLHLGARAFRAFS